MRRTRWGRRRAAAGLAALGLLVGGCAGGREKTQASVTMTAAQVYEQAQVELSKHSLRKARLLLEKIEYTAEDRPRIEPLVRIGLADTVFYLGDDLSLIEARSKYSDFVTIFSDHPLAPYAQFQAGVCSYKQVEVPSRDQSQARVAIEDLREVARRYPDSPFARAADQVRAKAESNLAEHEFIVGRFYLQRKKYRAATDRFRTLLEKFPRYGEPDKLYFHLGKALLLGEGGAEANAFLDRVVADYPESEYADEAKKLLSRSRESSDEKPKSAS